MTNPMDDLTVVWNRNPHIGIVEDVQIWSGTPDTGTLLFDTSASAEPDDALDHLMRIASHYYKSDPRDTDSLPPDYAVIAAYWDHLA